MPTTRAQSIRLSQNSHSGYKHHDTPKKNPLVFEQFGVSKARGWEILRSGRDRRRLGVDSTHTETRGRPLLISPTELHKLDQLVEDLDCEGRSISWETLAHESGLDVSARIIKRAMGTLNYRKCIACKKGWVNKATAANRKQYAELMLERYPQQKDWYHGQLRIIRKPGQRYCANCFHFKSPLVFYNINTNTNRKITQRAYIDQILEPIAKPWIKHQPSFVLEEDRDSGHGTSKSNIVRTWKQANSLNSYFNCSSSPDLSPIENAWSPMKQYVRKYSHWDIETTQELAVEGWDSVRQRYIDRCVLSMPQRLKDVVEAEGRMTGW
ncbi:hypothetical protein BU23DRAFT_630291 [Bimuria novae-zelandiae CBS 107.79]|uniref:Tc1-like transposase DDE domain-containing protein n=1 Tax=Bimuria novae-zelandiae CBS 107.79 TaxID=1447943 RepID=A0A6A5VJ28_9PLEO|nr:hypothetical protein BU23DRAFT_630291 [Bimuria novae-zelandiae CBS 107.79]